MAIPILGKILDTVFDKGADLISEFITDKDKAAEFTHKFKMAVLGDKAAERQVEADMFAAQQETIQAELHQNDTYTKRTRPKIARQSWQLTIAYAVFSTIVAPLLAWWTASVDADGNVVTGVFNDLKFQWEVFIAIASPALTYMGVRTFDKWKLNGGSK